MPKPEHLKHKHPTIREFAGKLQKREAITPDRERFHKWANGPKIAPEDKPVAEELLAEFDAMDPSERRRGLEQQASLQKAAQHAGPASRGPAPVAGRNAGAADPKHLSLPFHNPYTFVPFGTKPIRRTPTLLTADEEDRSRFTGVMEIELRTLSPLLSCDPTTESGKQGEHRIYRALTVGPDVIVPATGVKGALRSLLTILTGGTLGYLDETVYLCQGRDRTLGPRGKQSQSGTPDNVFLARIVCPGSATRSGTVELGDTRLFPIKDLERALGNLDTRRPRAGERQKPIEYQGFHLKLSGRRVNTKGKQQEGGFKPFDPRRVIDLPPELWAAYEGRHRHGDLSDLRVGDLVWLEPKIADAKRLESAADIESIQWARWGRRGKRLLDLISERHPAVLPDAFNGDGLVDEVTDLFGQIPRDDRIVRGGDQPARAFAARVRPENLVFLDTAQKVQRTQLAPLAPPHPGCVAFYRDADDADEVNREDPLRGYKVYRTTSERGEHAPWHWRSQPTFGEDGSPNANAEQKINKTCDLLPEGSVGRVRLSLRSLSRRELALVLLACSVDWRLGGGKPLGLGHVRVTAVRLVDEFGAERLSWRPSDGTSALDRPTPAAIPPDLAGEVSELVERAAQYQSTQRPIPRLRYPRAVSENKRKQRGGHVWFQRHAQPKKTQTDGEIPKGLQVLWTDGELKARVGSDRIRAQLLPKHDRAQPLADQLYGYDGFTPEADIRKEGNNVSRHGSHAEFDPTIHARPGDASGGHHGQTHETRRRDRDSR